MPQYRQAEVSMQLQAQDEALRDGVLTAEKLLQRADTKYLEQQQAHHSKIETILDEIKQ